MIIHNNVNMCIESLMHQIYTQDCYDVIVLMTRKLYSLFRSYSLQHPHTLARKRAMIISSDAIAFFQNEIHGKKVLIIDDILIHGRTVEKMRTALSKMGVERIGYRVFAMSTEAHSCRQFMKLKDVQYSVEFSRSLWRDISRQIVNRIRTTLTPMRAASCYLTLNYNCTKSSIIDHLQGIFPSLALLNNHDPEYQSVYTYMFDLSLDSNLADLNKIIDTVKIQIDFSSTQNDRAVLLPHVFLKPLRDDDLSRIWACLQLPLENKYVSSADFYSYMYRFIKFYLTYLISHHLLNKLKITLQEDPSWKVALDDSDMLFYLPASIRPIMRKATFRKRFLDTLACMSIKKYPLRNHSTNIMEKVFCQKTSFFSNITDSGYADEVLYTMGLRDRIEGARTCYLAHTLKVSYSDLLFSLANSIVTIGYVHSNGWVTERIIPGEQAYVNLLYEHTKRLKDIQMLTAKARLESPEAYSQKLRHMFSANNPSSSPIRQRFRSILDIIMQCCSTSSELSSQCEKLMTQRTGLFINYLQYITDVDIFRLISL